MTSIIVEYLILLVAELSLELIDKHRELGMKASGEWERSVEVRGEPYGAEIWANDYTEWLARGRGPNKDQSIDGLRGWAAYYGSEGGPIYEWAKAKGIPGENFVGIAYQIARDGTRSYPEGTDLIDGVITEERVNEITEAMGLYVSSQIAETVSRDLKTAFAA